MYYIVTGKAFKKMQKHYRELNQLKTPLRHKGIFEILSKVENALLNVKINVFY